MVQLAHNFHLLTKECRFIMKLHGNVEMQDNTTIFTVSSSTQQIKGLGRYDPAVYNKIVNLRVYKKCQMMNNVISLLLM